MKKNWSRNINKIKFFYKKEHKLNFFKSFIAFILYIYIITFDKGYI